VLALAAVVLVFWVTWMRVVTLDIWLDQINGDGRHRGGLHGRALARGETARPNPDGNAGEEGKRVAGQLGDHERATPSLLTTCHFRAPAMVIASSLMKSPTEPNVMIVLAAWLMRLAAVTTRLPTA